MKNTPHSYDRVRLVSVAFRRTALSAACLLALSTGARAQSGAYDVNYATLSPTATSQALYLGGYTLSLIEQQDGTGALSGSVVGAGARSTLSGSTGAATPVTFSGNAVAASGLGNESTTLVDLGLLSGSGMGVMTGQVISGTANTTTGGLATTSKVQDAAVAVTQTGMGPAAITIDANTLSATTTLNRSNTTVAGATPATFSSGTDGSIAVTQTATTLESGNPVTPAAGSAASVNLGTYQSTFNAGGRAGSNALASNVDATLTLSGTTTSGAGTPMLSSPLAVTGNAVIADYTGNTASTVYSAGAGSGTFAGSVAVTNAQSNVETLTVGGTNETARVTGTQIAADVRNADTGQTDLTGALTLSSNVVRAASVGNVAGSVTSTGAVLAGNALVATGGASIEGSGSLTSNDVRGTTISAASDLVVANAQLNSGTRLASTITGSSATAAVDRVDGGSVTLSANAFDATSRGNVAGNLIQADATRLSATAALASLQTNESTPVTAGNTGTAIRAGIGIADGTSTGAVTVEGNTIGATAQGNLASNTVAMSATTLTAVAADGRQTLMGLADKARAEAGLSATNFQRNTGAVQISAGVSSGSVAANFTDDGTSSGVRTSLSGAAVTVDGNRIAAAASGNAATTSMRLSATEATLQAMIASRQDVEGTSDGRTVGASVTGSGIGVTSGGTSGSALTLGGNAVTAAATGNDATSSLTGAFTNLTVGVAPATRFSIASDNTASAEAALGLGNLQRSDSLTTASVRNDGGFATIRAGSTDVAGVSGGSLVVDGNLASASATVNRASNALVLDATNIATTDGAAAHIAGIASGQQIGGNADSTATVGTDDSPSAPLLGIQFQQALSGVSSTVSGNTASATTQGNVVRNTLAVSGANLSTAAPASGETGWASTGNTRTRNAFTIANSQYDNTADNREALANNVVTGIDGSGALAASGIDASTLAVTGNTTRASAGSNAAFNALSLTGFATLSSGASLSNRQDTRANVTGQVIGAETRISTTGDTAVTDSALAVTGNESSTLAIGASATNVLQVQAVSLTGNATPTGDSSVAPAAWAATAVGDFGIASAQKRSFTTRAETQASTGVDLAAVSDATLTGAAVADGSVTVDGNSTRAVAQGLSVSNTLSLEGTTVGDVQVAVANAQFAVDPVIATQTTTTGASFAVRTASVSSTSVSVSGNALLASAGQSEAFNTLTVSGATISGRSGTSFAVLNEQSTDSAWPTPATSSAMPGLLGMTLASVTNGSATVAGNSVTAKSNVNTASNALTLDAQSALSGNGLVRSTQTSYGAATATVGDTAGNTTSTIGVAAPVAGDGIALNGTSVSVSGNSLNAQAGGNTVSNALNATAVSSIGAGTAPTFAVLNTQTSTGAMTAQLAHANVGAWGAGTGGAFGGTAMTVAGNQANASAYANTASNTVAMSVLPGSANAASTSVWNTQSSSGAVSATASNVNFGATVSGATGGGAIVMSGNATLAQVTGNTAVNRLIGR